MTSKNYRLVDDTTNLRYYVSLESILNTRAKGAVQQYGKGRLCRNFHSTGRCKDNNRCTFAHVDPSNLGRPEVISTTTSSSNVSRTRTKAEADGSDSDGAAESIDGDLLDRYFEANRELQTEPATLFVEPTTSCYEYGLLGKRAEDSSSNPYYFFINIHEPFAAVICGVQGSGKSHTLNSILEMCVVKTKIPSLGRLKSPILTLVLHFDSTFMDAESLSLLKPNKPERRIQVGDGECLHRRNMCVFVSPTNLRDSVRNYYERFGVETVYPLYFKWEVLSPDQIRSILRIGKDDEANPAFARVIRQLRELPLGFKAFKDKSFEGLNEEQRLSLQQRFDVLEHFLKDVAPSGDILEKMKDTDFILCELSDTRFSCEELNGVFQVVVESFRTTDTPRGKLLAIDEAHNLLNEQSSVGLSSAVVQCVRSMRHDNIRVAISTQTVTKLPPELVELSSLAIMHRFHSREAFTYLTSRLCVERRDEEMDSRKKRDMFHAINGLNLGEAIVLSRCKWDDDVVVWDPIKMQIRPRLTTSTGQTKQNGK